MKLGKSRLGRIVTVVGLVIGTSIVTASPASAAVSHGYCGHATSVNWVTGDVQDYYAEHQVNMNRNKYHIVKHYNKYTLKNYGSDLHLCH